jgi:ribosomal protein L32
MLDDRTPATWRAVCINPDCPEAGHPWNAPEFLEDCPDCGKPLLPHTPHMQRVAQRQKQIERLELALVIPAALLVCGLLAFLMYLTR